MNCEAVKHEGAFRSVSIHCMHSNHIQRHKTAECHPASALPLAHLRLSSLLLCLLSDLTGLLGGVLHMHRNTKRFRVALDLQVPEMKDTQKAALPQPDNAQKAGRER